jgi:hypothetical protein
MLATATGWGSMAIASLGPVLCGATRWSPSTQKGHTSMGLFDALLSVGMLLTAYLLLFITAR